MKLGLRPHRIRKEIGPGERIALSKLAIEKFEQTGRPLRIAIDISIWLFQIQSGKGIKNGKTLDIPHWLMQVAPRWNQPCASNLLLPIASLDVAIDPPSLRFRWAK